MSTKKDKLKEDTQEPDIFPELEEQAQEGQAAQEEEAVKEKTVEQIIQDFPGGPTPERVLEWKDMYGEHNVYASMYNEHELYIYRPLLRLEWKNLMAEINKASPEKRNYLTEEMIVNRAMLFPVFSVDFKQGSTAGTITSIYTQILMVSNFINDAVLESLIVKL